MSAILQRPLARRRDVPLAVLVVAVAVSVIVVHQIAHTCGPVGTVPISQRKRKASGWGTFMHQAMNSIHTVYGESNRYASESP